MDIVHTRPYTMHYMTGSGGGTIEDTLKRAKDNVVILENLLKKDPHNKVIQDNLSIEKNGVKTLEWWINLKNSPTG